MKISLETKSGTQSNGDLLVIPYLDHKLFTHSWLESIHQKIGKEIRNFLKQTQFKGDFGESQAIAAHGKIKFNQVLVLGLGEKKQLNPEKIRKISARVIKTAQGIKAKQVVSLLAQAVADTLGAFETGQAMAEGSMLSAYRFDKYKAKNPDSSFPVTLKLVLGGEKQQRNLKAGVQWGQHACEGAYLARDLVNTPSRDKAPSQLAKEAKKLKGIRTRVFDHRKIQEIGMGALYGVGMGSSNPPTFIEMHYRPTGRIKKSIAIVGKGITFDSGGLSLKPPKGMENMKDDMAGSAAVLGVMKALPMLKPNVEVFGYVASAENMPDGAAQRPGDVVKAYNGKTIEVLNTDAEGRLALADALSFVTKHRKVDYIIDLATLTGAALVALGDLYSAALGTDDALIESLQEAGQFCGENIWPLPLVEEYWDGFRSDVADMKNIGGMWAGTINGGLFLKQFVDEKAKWVHLDIAGPSWASKPSDYLSPGGTGVMVRTLLRFFSQI